MFKSGVTVGNGAAINIELGWIPDFALLYNATDGDLITAGFLRDRVIPFSDGGDTAAIAVGETITGATSGATAVVKQVLLYSGSWAGGDAAGFFVIDRDSQVGTFTSEEVAGSLLSGDATVTVDVVHNVAIAAAAAGATGNSALAPYAGSAGSASKGFTIGSTIAEEAKLLRWAAWRDEQ